MKRLYWSAFRALTAAFALFFIFGLLPVMIVIMRLHATGPWPWGYIGICTAVFLAISPVGACFVLHITSNVDADWKMREIELKQLYQDSRKAMLWNNFLGLAYLAYRKCHELWEKMRPLFYLLLAMVASRLNG